MTRIAPAQRIRCRNAEWLVKKIDTYEKGQIITCVGLDPLVKNQERIFVEPLDRFEVVEAEKTILVSDTTNQYKKTKFYLEARLRNLPVIGQGIQWDELGVFTPYQFQKETVQRALEKIESRLLIA
jgi:hypothetical protein